MNAGEEQQGLKVLEERLQRIEGSLADLHRKVDELDRKMDLATAHSAALAKQYQTRP